MDSLILSLIIFSSPTLIDLNRSVTWLASFYLSPTLIDLLIFFTRQDAWTGFTHINYFLCMPLELKTMDCQVDSHHITIMHLSSRTLVYLKVNSIFTVIPISLSQSSRQLLYRYIIHARPHLTARVLRYLWTLIGKAAIVRGFYQILVFFTKYISHTQPKFGRIHTQYFVYFLLRKVLCFN